MRVIYKKWKTRLAKDGLSSSEKDFVLEAFMYTWKFFLNLIMTVIVIQLSAKTEQALTVQQRLINTVQQLESNELKSRD